MLTYDMPAYADSLSHIGSSTIVNGGNSSVIKRAIPQCTSLHDAMGVWPYSSVTNIISANEFRNGLIKEGFITYSAVLKPDSVLNKEEFIKSGFQVRTLKDHFVHDPKLPTPVFSTKTRFNISRGMRNWDINLIKLADFCDEITEMHEALATSRSFSEIVHVNHSHFQRISQLPGVKVIGAFDDSGLGAALIAIHNQDQLHFHAIVGSERAYKNNAFYALYKNALEIWGGAHTIYMGGVPTGINAAGIQKFKERFSNRKSPVVILETILDSKKYNWLTKLANVNSMSGDFFPSYRNPNQLLYESDS